MAPRRGPHRGPGAPVEKPKDFKGTIRKLIRYMGAYRIALIAVIIFAIGSTVFNVIGPKILGNATTELFEGLIRKLTGQGEIDFGRIGAILLGLMGLYALSALLSFAQGWIMTGISQKMSYRMRRDISEKIDRMPLGYFESNKTGDVLSRITNDVDTLGQSLNQSITQLITSVCTLIGTVVMMLTISPLMTLITLIILPVSVALVAIVVKISQKHFYAQQHHLGEIDGQIEETFTGHNIVKAFNREERELEEFRRTNDKLYTSAWKSQFLSGLMMPIMNFVSNLGYVAVAVAGAMLAAKGTITIGDITAFIQYVKRFTQPITQLAQVSNMLQSMAAAAERIFLFLDEPEEIPETVSPVPASVVDGRISFDHVRFGYDSEKPVIHDFSCEVQPGQMVAIVGPTGAGKTTMVKLLMRFYDTDSGDIRLNGHSVRDFARGDLRQSFGMVLQDTWLFHGTIMENIRYGRLDATDAEVIAAAKAARAHRFIRSLPGGYQMELNEDATNISQGQKQLLTIARAILANNPVLILDEATSSVDTRTERLIQAGMANLMKGRTTFVIAHRLSTIRDADLILVMRDGDIVEQGDHETLLRQNGFYAELYNSQFEDVG
ncbi:MAG: ABC transporter ATP-binding protein [Oscillospiraceae bacterium]|nr:ABC transporter ATP-binding protein [Oscillospiraceae bacterium]